MNKRLDRQGRVMEWLHGPQGVRWGTNPHDYDSEAVLSAMRHVQRFFGPRRYFSMQVEGLAQVPPAPVMVVSNHSGGTSIPDAWGLMLAWYEHFGVERPIHPMAHDMVFSNRVTGPFFSARGALRADRELAIRVLRDFRRDLVVMPGGDLETWRPYHERYKVRFSGRLGYARMAIQAGVPIVPVAHAGAHETLIVLARGERLARALHLPELVRASIFPVHLSLPFGLTFGPFPHIPPPTLLRYRVATPVYPPVRVAPGEEPPEDAVRTLDRAVREAIQGELAVLAWERETLLERVGARIRKAVQSPGAAIRARAPLRWAREEPVGLCPPGS
ncbi:MAG: 1-acyl-sn-glycerol-3-phosphate acyltransferase [Deltaproteobacteria bacterium]|nr:1-acyl-sn-glycerol-3-phosphate acyltransferase [Deltaproteobacteria bacterium]